MEGIKIIRETTEDGPYPGGKGIPILETIAVVALKPYIQLFFKVAEFSIVAGEIYRWHEVSLYFWQRGPEFGEPKEETKERPAIL